MTKDLTVGSPLKRIIGFAIPVYLGMLFQQFYNIVDTVIVGQLLGVGPLAGVGSTGSLNFFVLGFCIGICSGFSIPIAQRFGAKDESGMRRYIANSLWLCAGFSLVITALVCIFCPRILRLMNTPEDIFEYAQQYVFIIFLGIPFTVLYNILAGIFRALGDSRSPVLFLSISSVLNIALDFLFIAVLKLGVRGPALATVLSQALSALFCILYMKKKYAILRMTREELRIVPAYMRTLCYMGVPMGLQYSVTAIGAIIVQAAMNGFGSNVVAGVTAAQRIHSLMACPVEALGSTMAPYSGQNMGAKRLDRITRGVFAATLAGFAASAVIAAVVLLFGRQLVGIFLDVPNEEVIAHAARFLITTSCSYALLTVVNVWRFSIQGMGYSMAAIISGVMEMLARSMAGLWLAPAFGFSALCFAHPLAWLFADCFLIPAFFICRNRVEKKLN